MEEHHMRNVAKLHNVFGFSFVIELDSVGKSFGDLKSLQYSQTPLLALRLASKNVVTKYCYITAFIKNTPLGIMTKHHFSNITAMTVPD